MNKSLTKSGETDSGRPSRKEEAWLRNHSHEYIGQWVALAGEEFFGADPSYIKVMEKVKLSKIDLKKVLLSFQVEGRYL